jgi:hypothetical protein
MKEADKEILEIVRLRCMQEELNNDVQYSIQDLELLIERHTQNRYHEVDYKILFNTKALFNIVLEKEDADNIVYFLFYLLFNYPDRAAHTAYAIKKCYNYNILEGCYRGIKIYMQSDDFATINLMEGIINNYATEELPQHVLILFESVKLNGLPYSRDYVNKINW